MSTIYRNAADLHRAILDAAAHAPADACAHALPDWRPAEADEAPANIGRTEWRGPFAEARDAVRSFVAMQGPTRPAADKLPRAVFRFTTGPGSVSSLAVVRTAPRLAELAETVRKRWALFGGGAKPEEIKPRQAPRRAEWSPAIFKAWRLQLQDADHVGAMLTAERIGARYYPGGGERGCFALAAPVQVQGMPAGFCSFLRDDGRWIVADEVSGLAVGDSAASRRAAEAGALERWADASEEKRAAALERARRDPPDMAAARAAWCKAYGIADPAAPAALAGDPAPAADLAPTPAAEVAPAAPLAAAPTPPDSTSREGAPDSTNRETIGAAPAWQILAARPLATYCTPVRRIGVHEWAAVVYVHDVYGACTDYVWRRVDTARAGGPYEGGRFFAGRDWPTYDSNRANYGQPATLAALYEAHREEIGAALDAIRAGVLPDWAGPQHAEALQSARQAEERRAANLARLATSAPRPAVAAPAADAAVQAAAMAPAGAPSAPIADAPIRTDRAEPARAAAPAWFDLPRAAVYRAHVATAAIACALYPEPCGPCEDNPRQWIRARRAPEFRKPEVQNMRTEIAAAMRLARAGHPVQLAPLDKAEARRLADMRPPAELRERARAMSGQALRVATDPHGAGPSWAAKVAAASWARAAVYREAARLADMAAPPPTPYHPDPVRTDGREDPRAYADRRHAETGRRYLVTGQGHAMLDCPDNRRTAEDLGGVAYLSKRGGPPGRGGQRTGARPATYAEAMAAGRDAGNRSARAAGRGSWARPPGA